MRPDRPTRDGRGVRFGCGLVFGLPIGFLVPFRYMPLELGLCLACAGAAGLVIGLLSAAYGDRFWYGLLGWFRWMFNP